ncbi:hypothetical protein EMPS_09297 [Entomortierella parvispora]|uniref:Uncharacterized protein n=1 Tax=Entomortierella parvispora TaxID=205924 RepID=A0A9P3HIA6_9FUNG|nr:hypothetical protein EMPS_09297 [Entomortierella parvispora]
MTLSNISASPSASSNGCSHGHHQHPDLVNFASDMGGNPGVNVLCVKCLIAHPDSKICSKCSLCLDRCCSCPK